MYNANTDNNENLKMANLYYKLYLDCMNFKKAESSKKNYKKIDCEKYHNNYINFSSKLNNSNI